MRGYHAFHRRLVGRHPGDHGTQKTPPPGPVPRNVTPEGQKLTVLRSVSFHFASALALAVSGLLACSDATAADYSLTGFGTAGYAVSDQKAPYLRYIDKGGTLRADSLVGLQGEIQFDPQWGATVQVVASAPRYKEDGLAAQVRWAFVSYRPNNEWLFRVGRLRPPVLINTQNAEVGVTYDQARLPVEVYSFSPVYDVDGGSFTRTWAGVNQETSLDGYFGISKIKQRTPFQPGTAQPFIVDRYLPEKIHFMGLVLAHASGSFVARGGVHRANLMPDQGRQFLEDPSPRVIAAPPPFGGTLFVPGAPYEKVAVNAVTLGVDWDLEKWRVAGEFGRRIVTGTKLASSSDSLYLTVVRNSGRWAPYVTVARILSAPSSRRYYEQLNATAVPLAAQGAPFFLSPNYHRSIADSIFLFDQYSTMLGTSYNLSITSKLKFEWMRTKIGQASAFVDGDVQHKSFNVFSMSYNFSF